MIKYLLFLLFFSCAKTGYLIEQGVGQIALEWNGRDNSTVLADSSVPEESKKKIKLILKAKDFFYTYFKLEPTGIYDETTFLKSDAVTFLVIASPRNQIKAVKVKFPIMGSFPYLGFFEKASALEFKELKEQQGYQTYMREVYAYSTLNQWLFDDNILSSFFQLSDEALIELVFHELVHTVIFVKNDVSFNESLAQVISRKLLTEYLNYDQEKQNRRAIQIETQLEMRKLISSHVKSLNQRYLQTSKYEKVLDAYLEDEFLPAVKRFCENKQLRPCWPLQQKWNNARFAALGTYSSKQNEILDLYDRSNKSLKEFFLWITKKYDKFKHNKKFIDMLTEET